MPGGRSVDSGSVQRASKYTEPGSSVVGTLQDPGCGSISSARANRPAPPPRPFPCSLGAGCNFKVRSFCKFLTSIFPLAAPQASEDVSVESQIGKAVGKSDVWFRFNEGVSNAVRRNIYIKDLL